MKTLLYDEMSTKIFATRAEMGQSAAIDAAECLKTCLAQNDIVRCMFAAAPSQNEFLKSLSENAEIDWQRVDGFHMDEYIGLAQTDSRTFGSFLHNAIFSQVPFRSSNYINGSIDSCAECLRYGTLLEQAPMDIVFMGIGENGHIAFNDPPVADFNDTATIKEVLLDHACRVQQVNDGCFATLEQVPTHALTVTVPTMINAKHVFCIVPGSRKANAVKDALTGPVSTCCPASILRTKKTVTLYLDSDSASLL